VKQIKKYHAAAGESGHYRAQTPSLQTDRVSPVINGIIIPLPCYTTTLARYLLYFRL
jgi:hypothetical protein